MTAAGALLVFGAYEHLRLSIRIGVSERNISAQHFAQPRVRRCSCWDVCALEVLVVVVGAGVASAEVAEDGAGGGDAHGE